MTAEQSIRNIERTMDAVNKAARGELKVKPDPRADLVDLFEARAETHGDKSWIEVEEAVDLVMDRDAEVIRVAKIEVLREAAKGAEKAARAWRTSAADPRNPSGSAEWDRRNAEYRESAASWLRIRADSLEAEGMHS